MALRLCSTIVWIFSLVPVYGTSRFPPDMEVCSAKDPNLNECFKRNANILLPKLAKGMKSLGILPLDPLYVPEMGLEKGNTYLPNMEVKLTNTTHLGWRDAKVISARVDPEAYKTYVEIFVPKYEVLGDYNIDGSVLFIKMKGNGDGHYTFYNNTYQVHLTGEPVMRDNELYMDVKNWTLTVQVGEMVIKMNNLFNNKALSDVTNSLLNYNSKALLQIGLPATQDIFGEMYSKIIRNLFNEVPYRELYRDLSV